MNTCDRKVDLGRRWFLSGAGVAAAGAAAATVVPHRAEAAAPLARVQYPSNRLANISQLRSDEPFAVAYPDPNAPGVLLKLGRQVPGGVGPMATSSASPPCARTRVFPSLTTLPTRR